MRVQKWLFLVAAPMVLMLLTQSSAEAANQFRRWLSPKNFTCSTLIGGTVEVGIDNQNVEFANLPADAQFTINYIKNGVIQTDGPFTVEQTSGFRNYGAFATTFPSYPAHFIFRLDTLINGSVVYTSTIDINCAGDASGPATINNVDIGLSPDQYRRWSLPKTFTCSTLPGGTVQVLLDNQNVEFNNLPANAQYTINYIKNGVIQTDGPFTVEQTSGFRNYGAFATSFPSYPAHFIFRLDTLVGGVVVYRSSLDINCAADSSGPATRINEAVSPSPLIPVPALSDWMLLALALMLGGLAHRSVRRTRLRK